MYKVREVEFSERYLTKGEFNDGRVKNTTG